MLEALIECGIHVARKKWTVAWIVLATMVATTTIVFLLPVTYTSHARVLPSSDAKSLEGLGVGGGLGVMLQSSLGLGIGKDSKLEVLLSSDALPLAMVRKFRLDTVWQLKGKSNIPENQVRRWGEAFLWEIDENGMLETSFEDENPLLAREVVASVATWLDSAYQETGRLRARNQLLFIEARVAEREMLLQASEDSLAAFQSKNMVFSADEQIKQSVTTAANLETQVELLKMQKAMTVATLGASSPQVALIDLQERQLRSRINGYVNGTPGDSLNLLRSLRPALPLRLKFERLKRQQLIHSTVFGLLVQQREQLLVESVKSVPVLTTIDPPSLPRKKSWPPRVLLLKVAFFLSLTGAMAGVILREEFRRHRGSVIDEKIRSLVRALCSRKG